jgi:hypothetical protein
MKRRKPADRRSLVIQLLIVLFGTLAAILTVVLFWRDRSPQVFLKPFVEDVEALETVVEKPYSLFRHLETECGWRGINPDYCFCIAFRESGFRENAIGDSGLARGIFQFHLPTWQSFRKQMGESTKDTRISAYDSIQTFAWALSKGYDAHWTASRYCQEFK